MLQILAFRQGSFSSSCKNAYEWKSWAQAASCIILLQCLVKSCFLLCYGLYWEEQGSHGIHKVYNWETKVDII